MCLDREVEHPSALLLVPPLALFTRLVGVGKQVD